MIKITVTISPKGQVKTEANGIKGTGCTAILDALTANIGSIVEDTPTAEYYEAEQWESEDAVVTETW
jgi:hypothetical protein